MTQILRTFMPLLLFILPNFIAAQSGTWTWMKGDNIYNGTGSYGTKGVPAASNNPAPRYSCGSWTDLSGNFWIFGGASGPNFNGELGDLWKFDPNTMMWTWMSGSDPFSSTTAMYAAAAGVFDAANDPGPIGFGITTWTDKQNHLWMYGGTTSGDARNNLWQYDPATNQWAWMNGKKDQTSPPDYGVEGIGSITNTPGDRAESNMAWVPTNELPLPPPY